MTKPINHRNGLPFVLIPLVQAVFFIASYEITNRTAHRMGWVDSRGVSWGISVNLYFMIYLMIIAITGGLNYFIPERVLLISIIASIIFSSFVLPVVDSFPYRGSLVILIGVTGIFMSYFFFANLRFAPRNRKVIKPCTSLVAYSPR